MPAHASNHPPARFTRQALEDTLDKIALTGSPRLYLTGILPYLDWVERDRTIDHLMSLYRDRETALCGEVPSGWFEDAGDGRYYPMDCDAVLEAIQGALSEALDEAFALVSHWTHDAA